MQLEQKVIALTQQLEEQTQLCNRKQEAFTGLQLHQFACYSTARAAYWIFSNHHCCFCLNDSSGVYETVVCEAGCVTWVVCAGSQLELQRRELEADQTEIELAAQLALRTQQLQEARSATVPGCESLENELSFVCLFHSYLSM